jgi:hypothetical protein
MYVYVYVCVCVGEGAVNMKALMGDLEAVRESSSLVLLHTHTQLPYPFVQVCDPLLTYINIYIFIYTYTYIYTYSH